MDFQWTLKNSIRIEGIGLHSGKNVQLDIKPAEDNFGVQFLRTDLNSAKELKFIPAHIDFVRPSDLCTTLGLSEENFISTIEHLMAALNGLGVDNALIEINASEIPILDGSAASFTVEILKVGLRKQKSLRKFYCLRKEFHLTDGEKSVTARPSNQPTVKAFLDYPWKMVGKQEVQIPLSPSGFMQLHYARTFCHLKDVEAMRRHGLALGGSLENAIVVTDYSILNPEGLRTPDEFARHKVLDFMGDIFLLGHRIYADFELKKSGHAMHSKFVKVLLGNKNEYLTVVEGLNSKKSVPDSVIPLMSVVK